jgi:DNA-binding response OmpR family regulator
MTTILVIDDEKDVLKALRDFLVCEHFDVLCASTGNQGLAMAKEKHPDLILLDLRLPDVDGYDVCRMLKENSTTRQIPILMLSTRSKDTEKVIGLEIGADDYITKPYNELELLARIHVALRRKSQSASGGNSVPTFFIYGPIELNTEARSILVDNAPIKLTRKEFDMLAVFLAKPGKVFSRSSLLSAVWGEAYESLQGTVDSHIKTLRQKLGSAGKLIETVPAVGYRLKEDL